MFEQVKEILVDSLGCSAEDVTLEADLRDNLGADSLDAVEVIVELEDKFSVEIPDDVAEKMRTVQDIVSYLEAHQ